MFSILLGQNQSEPIIGYLSLLLHCRALGDWIWKPQNLGSVRNLVMFLLNHSSVGNGMKLEKKNFD